MSRHAGALAALLSTLLLLPASGFAATLQERIDSYQVLLQRDQQLPGASALSEELGLMRSWLTEAQSYAARDKKQAAERALERVQAQSELIDALVGRNQALADVTKAQARVQALQRQVQDTRNDIARLDQRRQALEKEATP
jgi:hypothetical protein